MTDEQVIAIKKYCEGAYPMMKSNDADSDLVWFDLLHEEEYYGILQSVKNYIRQGNKFPPTIAEIISGYTLIINSFSNEVLRLMDEQGYFDDPFKSISTNNHDDIDTKIKHYGSKYSGIADRDVASWNKENRKRKAMIWVSNTFPKEHIPSWFKEAYQKYEKIIKAKYFVIPAKKQLESRSSA